MNCPTRRRLEGLLYFASLSAMAFSFYLRFSGIKTLAILGRNFRVEIVDASIWVPLALILGIKWLREGKRSWAMIFLAIAIWKASVLFKGF